MKAQLLASVLLVLFGVVFFAGGCRLIAWPEDDHYMLRDGFGVVGLVLGVVYACVGAARLIAFWP